MKHLRETTHAVGRRLLPLVASILLCAGCFAPAAADDQETAIGKQVAEDLQKKGEIISSSPYYAILRPIARRIAAVADPQYDYPFHFILVHEKQPNAFAVPGGNVYVTDSLMQFVQNREELAGVLCHETSHDIHHDVVHNMKKDQNLGLAATAISILLGKSASGIAGVAVNYAANVQALTYSREVETQADLKGAHTCTEAGYNPWGMVWLFQQFEKADTGGSMEMLADHPTDSHRIANLENLFHSEPANFGRYSSDISTATAIGPVAGHAAGHPHAQPIMRAQPHEPQAVKPRVIRTPGPHDDEPTFP